MKKSIAGAMGRWRSNKVRSTKKAHMSYRDEQKAKYIGMWNAASSKRESLERARQYLITLSLERPDGVVNADDANQFIEHAGLPPLGNAAGSLFKNRKIWEACGWAPSERSGNHAHMNRQWRLKRCYDGVGDSGPNEVITASKKALTPSQVKKELEALDELYEEANPMDMSEQLYEAMRNDLYTRMK